MSASTLLVVEPGSPGFSAMLARLADAGLPTDDLHDADTRYFMNADGSAFGGLTTFGAIGLLRSVVVVRGQRLMGEGRMMLEELVDEARNLGMRELWLLTASAEGFFSHCGFVKVERDAAPAPIAATRQFRELCPASAALMFRRVS